MNYILQKYHRSVSNVAMVCVAAVALGSSTYAWFVNNNKVEATTTNISAQSNSAYLVIDTKATSTTSTSSATAAEEVGEGKSIRIRQFILHSGQMDLRKIRVLLEQRFINSRQRMLPTREKQMRTQILVLQ